MEQSIRHVQCGTMAGKFLADMAYQFDCGCHVVETYSSRMGLWFGFSASRRYFFQCFAPPKCYIFLKNNWRRERAVSTFFHCWRRFRATKFLTELSRAILKIKIIDTLDFESCLSRTKFPSCSPFWFFLLQFLEAAHLC